MVQIYVIESLNTANTRSVPFAALDLKISIVNSEGQLTERCIATSRYVTKVGNGPEADLPLRRLGWLDLR